MRKLNIGVIGDAGVDRESSVYHLSIRLGTMLIDHGYRIFSGGMSGVMEAIAKGAKQSKKYKEGMCIGILPTFDPQISNKYVDVVIPTGLDTYRNAIVANSDVVVAIGGRAGTLSEIAYAWTFKRMIIAFNVEGWSGKLADTRIDDRQRIPWTGDKIFKAEVESDVINYISKYFKHYNIRYKGLYSALIENNYEL